MATKTRPPPRRSSPRARSTARARSRWRAVHASRRRPDAHAAPDLARACSAWRARRRRAGGRRPGVRMVAPATIDTTTWSASSRPRSSRMTRASICGLTARTTTSASGSASRLRRHRADPVSLGKRVASIPARMQAARVARRVTARSARRPAIIASAMTPAPTMPTRIGPSRHRAPPSLPDRYLAANQRAGPRLDLGCRSARTATSRSTAALRAARRGHVAELEKRPTQPERARPCSCSAPMSRASSIASA